MQLLLLEIKIFEFKGMRFEVDEYLDFFKYEDGLFGFYWGATNFAKKKNVNIII